MEKFYRKSKEDVAKLLGVSENGLTDAQVVASKEKYGENRLKEGKRKGVLQVFLTQFTDFLVIILIIAAIISAVTSSPESTAVILVVIIVNAILGTVQYFKAEKSLDSLKSLSSPAAKVIRNGLKSEIQSYDVVVGDIIFLEAGDMVPADGRLIKNFSLQVNESALTGESESVNKMDRVIDEEDIALGDQKNMVFSGSMVTYGRGYVLVTAIGMDTELGKIATLMNNTSEKKTPLQVSLDNFSKKLSLGIIVIAAIVFALSMLHGMKGTDSLMFAVALAVAAIPEALSSIVTISLAIGTTKMAKENAIIKNLNAVESLGCVSIICSDKTGTLTQNKMTVQNLVSLENDDRLQLISILCNDSYFSEGVAMGDPTETSLITHYVDGHTDYDEIMKEYPRKSEIPFDSERKLMSTAHMVDGVGMMFTKGAVDVLLGRVTHILDNGTVREINIRDMQNIKDENRKMSESGLRVLAFAQKQVPDTNLAFESEYDYTYVGLISMMDPPREESKKAVAECIMAGIKPIMITGDHKITASAIAHKIGILKDGDMALEGTELNKLSDEELTEILPKVSVYARVSPEHKIRIVDMWQKLGHIVAMTGDGVNDAPALKKADIGIAMGITGTEVSKDAASMVLTDDNFATIVKSVTNGRNIYENIKNSIKFLLSGNMSGILAVVYTSVLALPIPFTAVHLLFINLLTDSLPAIAISMEKSKKDLLKDEPRSSGESILTRDFIRDVGLQGLIIAVFTMIAYYIGLKTSNGTASTMAFSTLCLARLWHGFNSRGRNSIFKLGLFTNMYSVGAFVAGVLFLSLALFVPVLQKLFTVTPLVTENVLWVGVLALIPTIIIQIWKVIAENRKQK